MQRRLVGNPQTDDEHNGNEGDPNGEAGRSTIGDERGKSPARYNLRAKTLKLSVKVFPELAELLECERPAEAGRSNSSSGGRI